VHPTLVRGYATEDAATVEIRGQISSGTYGTWTYQLVRGRRELAREKRAVETRLNSREP